MTYTYDDSVSVHELFELWEKMKAFQGDRFPAHLAFHMPLRDKKKEEESIKNTISVTARDNNGSLIGYLRILTDRAYIYYILDVMVDPKYRKKGIGSNLVELGVEQSKNQGFIKIFLTALPGTEKFYKKYGFNEGMSPVLTIRGEDYL